MKRNELKKVLKPLIKECIKECIFEEGVLSGIITEVAKGFESQKLITEGIMITKNDNDLEEKYERERQRRIKILNEGHPISPDSVKPHSTSRSGHGPMAGVDPDDSGINIDGLVDLVGTKWRKMV